MNELDKPKIEQFDDSTNTYERINENGEVEIVDCFTGKALAVKARNAVVPRYVYNDQYKEFIVAKMCEGESLVKISKLPGMPSMGTINRWRADNPEFNQAIEHAKEMRAEAIYEKIIDATDGMVGIHKDDVPAVKLKIDTLKWSAAVGRPDSFGATIKHKGDANAPLQILVNTGIERSDDIGVQSAIETVYKEVDNADENEVSGREEAHSEQGRTEGIRGDEEA